MGRIQNMILITQLPETHTKSIRVLAWLYEKVQWVRNTDTRVRFHHLILKEQIKEQTVYQTVSFCIHKSNNVNIHKVKVWKFSVPCILVIVWVFTLFRSNDFMDTIRALSSVDHITFVSKYSLKVVQLSKMWYLWLYIEFCFFLCW